MNSRRIFLQKLTASAITIPLLKSFSKDKEQISHSDVYDGPPLKVAIMGLGSYGTRVADAMKDCKMAKLTGAISGTPSKLTNWQSKYGIAEKNCYNYESFDAVKNNPDIDAIYVTTPNSLHHDLVIRVAKAGKHAICEKPMALTAKEGKEMVEACKKANVKLLVGYRLHF